MTMVNNSDFFEVIKVSEFVAMLRQVPAMDTEEASLEQAVWRTAAADIVSEEDLPRTNRSSMDGYTVVSRDTFGAGESNPVYLESVCNLNIQSDPQFRLESGQCAGIVTGATLPEGSDSVVMIEHVHEMGGDTIEVRKPVAPWENVMLKGEDIGKGETAIRAGQVVNPRRMGILAALGAVRIRVFKRPRVALMSTGDELVSVSQNPGSGYIRDVNSHALGQMVMDLGCPVEMLGIVPDDEEALEQALSRALETNDVVLVSGGSSVGGKDYTIKAMSGIKGIEILVRGLALSPGKPTIFARKDNKSVWGLPGQVTSAQVVMTVLVAPFIKHLQGERNPFAVREEFLVRAVLSRNLASRYGREDYVRVRLEKYNDQVLAVPITGKSGLLKTLVQAHGLVRIPDNCEGLAKGEQVHVRLF